MLLSELYQHMNIFEGNEEYIRKSDVITYNGGVLINENTLRFAWDEEFEKAKILDGEHVLKVVKTLVFPDVKEKIFKFSIREGKLVSWEEVF